MASWASYKFDTLDVSSPSEWVLQVTLNRPKKRNAMNRAMWDEIRACFDAVGRDPEVRVVILCGAGASFCAGLDLSDHLDVFGSPAGAEQDAGRRALQLKVFVEKYQSALNAIEKCRVPVIAAIHGACVGGGLDTACCCCIRLCSDDAFFCIKEVDIGLTADVGVLQRVQHQMGNGSLVRELAYTARTMGAAEARREGLISGELARGREGVLAAACSLAGQIAAKSPIAVVGTKDTLNYARDHTVEDGLRYVANWNMSMLQSSDVSQAAMASMSQKPATFSRL